MDNYIQTIGLLGLKDGNLPVFKDERIKKLNSIERIKNLINVAIRTRPTLPLEATNLNKYDDEWDDIVTYPKVDYYRYFTHSIYLFGTTFFYGYNYNAITNNFRLRFLRYFLPTFNLFAFTYLFFDYTKNLNKLNLFQEYCKLRSKELVEEYKFLLDHDDVKKYIYWSLDLEETFKKIHRQSNNNESSDFKDSELILQDFIRRYQTEEDILNIENPFQLM